MVVVMADAGYQLIASIIFVMVKRDFDYCEEFGSDRLGLGCDVVVEFSLGECLFVGGSEGKFLNLAGLIVNNGGNPGILAAFVAYFDCAGDFAVDLLKSGNRFQLQLLLTVDLVCHDC
ncbi:hypothetical protein [uncultured Nostoc sp.]|uniref:hypothetical protein n=1 Tax=uncultured Nostoc sp. TaxID=340711 RepID=UPI0035CAC7FE